MVVSMETAGFTPAWGSLFFSALACVVFSSIIDFTSLSHTYSMWEKAIRLYKGMTYEETLMKGSFMNAPTQASE